MLFSHSDIRYLFGRDSNEHSNTYAMKTVCPATSKVANSSLRQDSKVYYLDGENDLKFGENYAISNSNWTLSKGK